MSLFLGKAGKRGVLEPKLDAKPYPKVPLSWEQTLQSVNCSRLKGWQAVGGEGTTNSSEGTGAGWVTHPPRAQDNAARWLVWECRSLVCSATVRQLPRAEPREQKCVHMVSTCLRGETLILSCRLLAETPALPQPGIPNLSLACGIFSDLALNKYVSALLQRHSQRSMPEGDFVTGHTI